MNEEILILLESSNPADRKRAIRMMVKSEVHEDALRRLAAIYKNDPDADVREMAIAAGRHIKKEMGTIQKKSGEWEGHGVERHDPQPARKQHEAAEVSDFDAKRAEALMSQAMDALVSGESQRAMSLARQALTLNPNLRNDSYQAGVVGSIMNMEPEAAINALMSGALGSSAGGSKAKRKNAQSADEGSWDKAFVDLAIYGLVSFAIVFVGMLAGSVFLGNFLEANSAELLSSAEVQGSDFTIAQVTEFVRSIGAVFALIAGIVTAITSVIFLLVWFGIVHIAAKWILSGVGTYPGLIHKVTIPLVVWSIISGILSGIALVVLFQSNYLSAAAGLGNLDALQRVQSSSTLSNSINSLNSLGGLIFTFYLAKLIGDNYDFGLGKGCVSIILSYIILGLLGCGFVFIVLTPLLNSFANSQTFSSLLLFF